MDRQGDEAGASATVRIAPETAHDLARAVAAAGAGIDRSDPLVIVTDAREDQAQVAAQSVEAEAGCRALLAVVSDIAQAPAAFAAGATHITVGSAGIAVALPFAMRHARRVRAMGRSRRLTDATATDAPAAFLARHSGEAVTVALLALTSAEIVNAAFGRAAGDELMRVAEARIRAAMPPLDSLLLRDGPVFTLAMAATPPDALSAVSAIERVMAAPIETQGETIHIGMRIGVAHAERGEPPHRLLRRAAEALARAQDRDGAITQIAPGDAAPLGELAADLHRAIDRGEVDVLFQPQVSLGDGRIAGVEALARWRHPTLGPVGAETLFAAAERADIAGALSDHVQALALRHAAGWPPALADLRVAVNVTAADMARPDFVTQFLSRIDASGLPHRRVTVEITEGGLIEDLEGATRLLGALRAAGCRVAVDDFGTGYSSLAYLTALPIDYLKIDRRLTQDIAGDTRQRVVVEGVLAIAAALGLETIAEGVETEEQRILLAARGCTFYQGFLCSEPVDGATLARLMGVG